MFSLLSLVLPFLDSKSFCSLSGLRHHEFDLSVCVCNNGALCLVLRMALQENWRVKCAAILVATKAIWFSYRPDMRKLCLHEIFVPFPCRHEKATWNFHVAPKWKFHIAPTSCKHNNISNQHSIWNSWLHENICWDELHIDSYKYAWG